MSYQDLSYISMMTTYLFLNMPATLYVLTKKLSRILSVTLTLHRTLSPVLRRIKPFDPEYHKYDNAPVEVSLAAAVIVVLKLIYGLDGKKRVPRAGDDPACAMPDFQKWIEAVKRKESEEEDVRERLFETGEDM
jgi:RNA polymerase I-specific transcription initiation factor RRN7